MKLARTGAFSGLLLVLLFGQAWGQDLIIRDSRMRVSAPAAGVESLTCRGVAVVADTLVVDCGRRFKIPLRAVTSLEVSRGRKSRTLEGAAVGLIAGGALGLVTADDALARAGAGGVGLLLGLAVGTAISSERWERVQLKGLEVGFGPGRDGRLRIVAALRR